MPTGPAPWTITLSRQGEDRTGILPLSRSGVDARATLGADSFDAVNRCDQGATGTKDGFGRQIIGDFENIRAGSE